MDRSRTEREKIDREKAKIRKDIEKHLKEKRMENKEEFEIKVEIIKKAIDLTRNLKTELKEIILETADDLEKICNNYRDDGIDFREKIADLGEMILKCQNTDFNLLEVHTKRVENRIQAIQEQMDQQHRDIQTQMRTYAAVAATQTIHKASDRTPAIQSMVVTSKEETDTSEVVLEKIRKIVRATESGIKVERVRKAKDRKVVMGFVSNEEREQARKKLEGTGLAVEVLKNRDPLLVLKGVPKALSDEEVESALRNQNRGIFSSLDPGDDRLKIKYRRNNRNQYTTQVVLSASPVLWRRITDLGRVSIDLHRVVALDQSPLVQCTRCLGYGHSKRFCKGKEDICSHCGGCHTRDNCTKWKESSPPSCINCRNNRMGNIEHNAFDESCPIRKRWDTLARSTVAYH
ncbi:unnamed protein product [Euphydryas editha]|uniref:Gag-like protein n=1 Tax=Euphydryas editha TaxID=104508 RepID=A0AAU9UHP3_EUPED|nr:unnamed protein product [Euphydryas editha]